VGSGIFALYLD